MKRGDKMKIKVAEIISDTNIGGAGRLLLTRLSVCDRERFDERVVLPENSELTQGFLDLGYTPYHIRYSADKSFDIRAVFELYKYFRASKPDIINAHGCLSARIAAFFARVPIRIFTRHCAFAPSAFMRSFPIRKINGVLNRILTTRIIAVAEAAAENLRDVGISDDQIEVIINGVRPIEKYDPYARASARQKIGIPKEAFVCGICARLERCKGIDCLLRAAQRLIQTDEDYFFLIVGKGSLEDELLKLTDKLGISEKVKFCGFREDVTPYINCFDLNLNCSRGTETSSLALSEAMSIGIPSVASSWGGNPYMIRDGENGLVYPVDDIIALSECIERLKNDREMYVKMSDNSRRRFEEELNAEKMTKKTEEIYSSLFLVNKNKHCANRQC